MLGGGHAGERLAAGPLPFFLPPFAPFFPRSYPRPVTPKETHPVVTDRAFYTMAIATTLTSLAGKTRTPIEDISTVHHQIMRRRSNRGVQWVQYLGVTVRDGNKFQMETRFEGASRLCEALERAVAA